MFDSTISKLVDKYLPLKRVTQKEYKQQFKPWITAGIRKSIKRRDKILGKFMKSKDDLEKYKFMLIIKISEMLL